MTNRHIESVWLAQAFFHELILIYPVYAIMMLEAGLSGFNLSVLFIVWSLSSLLFEIPSGVIGDLVNRKVYVGLGAIIKGSGFLVWLLLPEFAGYAAGFLLWSLGSAVRSGTLQALLNDALAEQNRELEFGRIYGRGKAMESVGVLVAMGIGGFVAETGYTLPLILSAAAPLIGAMLVFLFIREPDRAVERIEGRFLTMLRIGRDNILRSRMLIMITVMMTLFLGVAGVVDEYIGPLLDESGTLSLGSIGLIYGIVLGARAVGAALAHRMAGMALRHIALLGLFAHGVLLSGLVVGEPALALLCACYFMAMGAVEVLLETQLQNNIDSHARATITSVAGAGMEAWSILLFLLIGLIADATLWTVAVAWVVGGTVVISVLLIYAAPPVAARNRS